MMRVAMILAWLVAFLAVMMATGTLIGFICCEATLPPL